MTLHNSSYSINWNWTHTHTYVHVHVYAHAWSHRIKLTIPTIKKDEVFKGVIDFVIPRWCIFLPSPPPFIPRLLSNDISEWMEHKTIDSFLNFSTRDTIRRKRYTTFFNNNNNTTFDSSTVRPFAIESNFSNHDRKSKEEKHSLKPLGGIQPNPSPP